MAIYQFGITTQKMICINESQIRNLGKSIDSLRLEWKKGTKSWKDKKVHTCVCVYVCVCVCVCVCIHTYKHPELLVRSTEPLTQWIQEVLLPGVKRPGRKADHSLPPSHDMCRSNYGCTFRPVFQPLSIVYMPLAV
jgi:hypothetical protein